MKVLALALVLLAVGAHGASIETSELGTVDHIRSFMDGFMNNLKDSIIMALNQLEGPEYEELKPNLIAHVENLFARITALRNSAAPVTDSILTTLADATLDFRNSVWADIETLKTNLEPNRVALQAIIDRHIAEYRVKIEPIVTEYSAKHEAEMELLKAKLDPILTELQSMIATNMEETKAAMMPMVEAVRGKVSERLKQLKTMVQPYVEEYKEHLKKVYGQVQSINTDELEAMKGKIEPLVGDIKVKLAAIFEVVSTALMKNN